MAQTKKKCKKIGVFDSGFGGLDILKNIVKILPKYEYVYLGDTARTPYGTRSKEIIHKFSQEAVNFLFNKGCELIIIACNTASCEALRQIQQNYLPKNHPNSRVLGVIIPAAEIAAETTKNNQIGIIATESTVRSGAFIREIKKINSNIKIWQKACPLLVPIIEAGEINNTILEITLKKYLKPLIEKNIDTLILGCTHYGIIKDRIQKITGKSIQIISEGPIVADKLKSYLNRHKKLEKKLAKNKKVHFYTTDLTESFERLGSKFFTNTIKAKKINIE